MKTTETMLFFWSTSEIYSNWHPAPFVENDIEFAHSEQYMMWRKAECFGNHALAARMLKETNPRKLKALGREVQGFDENVWEQERLPMMIRGCYLKFSQNPEMRAALLATGNRTLAEASPVDAIWGIGLAEDDPRALDPASWRGRNLLGHALMEVRRRLQDEQAASAN